MSKPKVFIGSASEALTIARAIQNLLSDVALVTVWKEDSSLSMETLSWLINNLGSYDFAVMVFTPHDTLISRKRKSSAVRDNVLFELGLFMGRIGPERTFIVCDKDPKAKVKIPADLLSFGLEEFSGRDAVAKPQSNDDRYDYKLAKQALGPACGEIRDRIGRMGSLTGLQEVQHELSNVSKRAKKQQETIKRLVETSISQQNFDHLAGITILVEYLWQNDFGDLFKRQFYFLKDRGLIGPSTVEFKEIEPPNTNMVGRVIPTDIGKEYIKLNKDKINKDWLRPEKRERLRMDVLQNELKLKLVDDKALIEVEENN